MFQLLELIENEEDREFCRKLSEQFDSAMYHVAYGILKNSADAEDAVQESYIAIINNLDKIIYIFLTIFLYLLKCPQSLILSALRAFCFCGKPHISRSIFLYFRYQAWLKSW